MTITTAGQNVVLVMAHGVTGGFGGGWEFQRKLADGDVDGGPEGLGYRVPPGQVLVITDVDWQYRDPLGTPQGGKAMTLWLAIRNLVPPGHGLAKVFQTTIVLNQWGEGGVNHALTSGFAIASGCRIEVEMLSGGDPQEVILRGYLVPDLPYAPSAT